MGAFDQISAMFTAAVNKQRTAEYQSIFEEVQKEYPVLQKHQLKVIAGNGSGYAETYPSFESESPMPGVNLIEIRNKDLTRDQLKSLIIGESLHILGGTNPETGQPVDKGFRKYKDQFVNALTPEQLTVDRMSYRSENKGFGVQGRDFDQWFDVSRADAYFRGNLFPVFETERQDWSQGVTQQQQSIMNGAVEYLKGKR